MEDLELNIDMDLDLNKEEIISTFTTEELLEEIAKRKGVEMIQIGCNHWLNIPKAGHRRMCIVFRNSIENK